MGIQTMQRQMEIKIGELAWRFMRLITHMTAQSLAQRPIM